MNTYIISEAAKLINVETHVLRYWEDELDITILRNEMGHRCYRDSDIDLLKKIKNLKDLGIHLNALKRIIPDIDKFKNIMNNIISEALMENNNKMCNEISESVSFEVAKELNNIIKKHENNEEERYRQFDLTLREYQKNRMMAAIANEGSRPKKKKSKFFKKNNVYI